MSAATNKAIACRLFEEIWNTGNLAVADDVPAPHSVGGLPGQVYEKPRSGLIRSGAA